MLVRAATVMLLTTAVGVGALGAAPHQLGPDSSPELLGSAYLEAYYRSHPVRATRLGVHTYDGELPDGGVGAAESRADELREWIGRFRAVGSSGLTTDQALDLRILDHAARAELLEIEDIRAWRRNPMVCNRIVANGVASLVDRDFAPLEVRLGRLVERLEQVPRFLTRCRKRLADVPAVWAEIAAQNTRGSVSFLSVDVPRAVRASGRAGLDPALIDRFERSRRRAERALGRFADWLENKVLPRANGDFRLGRSLFELKLRYDEHVDHSVETLIEMNEAAIARYRSQVAETAALVDPSASDVDVMNRITANHPSADDLIATARRFVDDAREFVIDHELLTLPTDTLPVVRPTPPYARMGFASMSTPGPFEDTATEAYYNVTNVDPEWSAEKREQHLTYFNYPGLLGISIHEAMPGHFVQLLYQRELPTDVRKVFAPSSLVEGWAHYTEQMMVDEGLGDGDPAVRLGQLRRALQRHARWDACIALHVQGASIEQAAERFAEIAYFAPFPALREVRRATYDPTYLYYALGRLQIFELREEYRREVEARGEVFSLREFHDRFLKLGLPISLARRVMLGP